MLEVGMEAMGMVHRVYDKYGKRMFTATPKKDMSLKDASLKAGRKAGSPEAVPGAVKRSDVGIK